MKNFTHFLILLGFITLATLACGFRYRMNTGKALPSHNSLELLLNKRYSGYNFDPARKIPPSSLETILNAGRLAPSAYNEQPWNFIVCNKDDHPMQFEAALHSLPEATQHWAQYAPTLIIVIINPFFSFNDQESPWAMFDTGAATAYMALQATTLHLIAHLMGHVNADHLRHHFSIPEPFEPIAIMALGFPPANEAASPKDRKTPQENFFEASWGMGYSFIH